jgi:hypothetical protein
MMWVAECGYEPRAIMCCTPTVRLVIVWTLPPRYRCPLNRLPAPRFSLPRSGLERSDFVQWHIAKLFCSAELGRHRGMTDIS